MFILLSVVSVLVISTLVVASLYFLKPGFESTLKTGRTRSIQTIKEQQPLSTGIKKSGAENSVTNNAPGAPEKDNEADNEANNEKEQAKSHQSALLNPTQTDKPDNCNIRFRDNQLMVKNSDQNIGSE